MGHDTLHGNSQNNRLNGGAGNDQLYGYEGDDWLWGEDGDNNLLGGVGNDRLIAMADNTGKNYLNGETGNDILTGYDDDTLYGGDGNDLLDSHFVGEGFNLLYGGNDNDSLFSNNEDTLYGENGNDTLFGGRSSNYLDGGDGNDRLYDANKNGDDRLIGSNYSDDTLYGGNGEDYLDGDQGNNLLDGGAGNDTLNSDYNSKDTINGGSGTDILILQGTETDYTFTRLNGTLKITLKSNPAIVKTVTEIESFKYQLDLIHFDFRSRVNFGQDPLTRDVIVNRSQNTTDSSQKGMSIHNETLITQSFATFKGGRNGNGLPDNGFFPANSFHPDVQLEYRNTDSSENAKVLGKKQSYTAKYINSKFLEIHVFATSSYGATMEVDFLYHDGTSEKRKVDVPDWFDEIPKQSFERYYLIDGLDSNYGTTGNEYWDSNDQAIFGFGFKLNPEKRLKSFTISNHISDYTNSSSFFLENLNQKLLDEKRMLTVFGATGVYVLGQDKFGMMGLVIDGYIADGQIFFDANLNGVLDDDEPLTITQGDGSFDLDIDIEQFDTNQDGKLDHSEGQLVLMGGIDVATGLAMSTPLTSTIESTVVTPLTTIIAELVKQGTDPATAENQVKSALGLPADIDLNSYDPLEAIANGEAEGVSVFGSMIQVQNTIVQMAKFMNGVSEREVAELAYSGINAISNQTKSGTPVDLTNTETIQSILEDAITQASGADPNINPTELVASAVAAAEIMALGNQIVKELVESGRPVKEIATDITKSQAVSVGQVAVGLPELASGIVSVEEFLAENTKEAILERMETVEVKDPTVRPIIEDNFSNDDGSTDNDVSTDDGSNDEDSSTDNDVSTDDDGSTDDPIESTILPIFLPPIFDSNSSQRSESDFYNSASTTIVNPIARTIDCIESQIALPSLNQPNIAEIFIAVNTEIAEIENGKNQEFVGTNDPDSFNAKSGNDNLYGLEGNDTLLAQQGNDYVEGGGDQDSLRGGKGADILIGNFGDDTIYGDRGDDSLHGSEDNDLLYGGKDDDFLLGGKGTDTLYGQQGNDTLFGNQNDDFLVGGQENDTLCGGIGNDILNGDEGDDILDSGNGLDLMNGGVGNDTFYGCEGDNTLTGELGNDLFIIGFPDSFNVITDFTQNQDKIMVAGMFFTDLNFEQDGVNTLIKFKSNGQQIANLLNVNASSLTSSDFSI